MHTSCTNPDAVICEQTSFPVELLMCGTVYLTVSVLRVCLLLSTLSVQSVDFTGFFKMCRFCVLCFILSHGQL